MPDMSNILICDMPVRFDTYSGCSHMCRYCFVKRLSDISKIEKKESAKVLYNFIQKRRAGETVLGIFDYDIPIHWGGLSDPFQPAESLHRESLKCLQVFRDTQYPFVVSTKGSIIADDEYLAFLKDCDCAVQISAVCSSYDKSEPGAPSYDKRVDIMGKISKYKRVIVRIQPLLPSVADEVINNLPRLRDAGVYGVIVEFMKYRTKKEGTVKVQGDHAYPLETIKPIFDRLKNKAHDLGLKVFSGENRLRQYGDGLNCCGVGDMWKCHTHNLNHAIFGDLCFQPIHDVPGTIDNSFVFGINNRGKALKLFSYKEILGLSLRDKGKMSNYFIPKENKENVLRSRCACDKDCDDAGD